MSVYTLIDMHDGPHLCQLETLLRERLVTVIDRMLRQSIERQCEKQNTQDYIEKHIRSSAAPTGAPVSLMYAE